MGIGDSASLLFRIKGDASDAVRAFNQTETAQGKLTGSTSALTGQFGSLEAVAGGVTSAMGPVTIALGVMTAATGAAITALKTLFDLSSSAAEWGSAIYDAQQKTGLTVESLQALQVAADQSGSSFEEITANVSKFNVLLGEANEGNEKARATLEKYGITATDTNGALEQAVKTIAEMTSVDQQAAAAKALFKDRTAAILPVIKSFDGDLPGLINKLRDLGVLVGQDNVKAADEFGDQMDLLKLQLAAIGRTIGFEVLPIFLNMARSISSWLAENKESIKSWAHTIKQYLDGVIIAWQLYARAARVGLALIRGDVQGALIETTLPLDTGPKDRGISGGGARANTPSTGPGPTGGGRSGGGRSSRDTEAGKAQREAERLAQRELQANIQIELNNLKTQKDQFLKVVEDLRSKFQKDSDITSFAGGIADAFESVKSNFAATLSYIEQLERQAQGSDATEGERNLLIQKQQERRNELVKLGIDINEKNHEIVIKNTDDLIEKWKEEGKAYGEKVKAQNDADRDRAEFQKQLIATTQEQIDELQKQIGFSAENIGHKVTKYSPFQDLIDGWNTFYDQVKTSGPDIEAIVQSMGGIFIDVFNNMADALGRVVETWVLTGNTGPAVMRKILASALATIAAEAAVRAIYELALGFAALFLNPPEAAAHFTAAALFGAVAGVAAIAGRAVAGDAFKKQTGAATGKSLGSGSANSGDHSNQGQVYSSQKKGIVEESRNEPSGVFDRLHQKWRDEIQIKLSLDSKGVLRVVHDDIQNNGQTRVLIQENSM